MADKKAYDKQHYLNNKDKIKEQKKQYRLANKEKIAELNKEHYLNNKEHIAEQHKQYYKTENGKKSYRITTWKQRGVITENFDELYDKYINTNNCEECNVELIHGNFGNNKKCLDHDHETGQFRNVLCCGCNLRRR